MTVQTWLERALADVGRRKLPELGPDLEALALAIQALRNADFNQRADGDHTRRADH